MDTKFTASKSINLRSLTINDYQTILKWSKDRSFCLANGWEENRSSSELYNWWLKCVNSTKEDFIRMGVEWNDTLVGYADLACIKENRAEIGIAIGESEHWGKGIGFNAAVCMMNYGLEKLGIRIFTAETHEANVRSRKMLEKLGFREVSRIVCEEYLGVNSQLIQYQLLFQ